MEKCILRESTVSDKENKRPTFPLPWPTSLKADFNGYVFDKHKPPYNTTSGISFLSHPYILRTWQFMLRRELTKPTRFPMAYIYARLEGGAEAEWNTALSFLKKWLSEANLWLCQTND